MILFNWGFAQGLHTERPANGERRRRDRFVRLLAPARARRPRRRTLRSRFETGRPFRSAAMNSGAFCSFHGTRRVDETPGSKLY